MSRLFGTVFETLMRRNPVGTILALAESKHVGTYRAVGSKDSIALMQAAMVPAAQAMLRVNHQRNRARLETQVNNFGAEIRRSIRQIRSGMPKGLVMKDLKDDYRRLYQTAYSLGMGSSATGLVPGNYTKSAEDNRWVESAFRNEMRYFNQFVSQALSDDLSSVQIDQRVNMYCNAVRGVYEGGRVVGAHPDSLIFWIYTPEAQHCSGCLFMRDHSPYTKRTLPTTPRAGACACLSNCRCHIRIVISDSELVKQTESRSLSKSAMLIQLSQMKRRGTHGQETR